MATLQEKLRLELMLTYQRPAFWSLKAGTPVQITSQVTITCESRMYLGFREFSLNHWMYNMLSRKEKHGTDPYLLLRKTKKCFILKKYVLTHHLYGLTTSTTTCTTNKQTITMETVYHHCLPPVATTFSVRTQVKHIVPIKCECVCVFIPKINNIKLYH